MANPMTGDTREQRGLALAALCRIDRVDGKYVVPSQRGDGVTYVVDPAKRHCTCRDHEDRLIKCKHMFAVEFVISRETHPDGSVTVEKTITVRERVTYKQDWPNYNKAQTTEKARFQVLLHELCRGLDEPRKPTRGRQPVLLSDAVFAAIFKVFSTVSGRRFQCDLRDAEDKGHVSKAPMYNTIFKYLAMPSLTPILHRFITQSALPLASVETDFAVDSSGFSTSRFVRWFDMKYGKTMEEQEWVKVHLMTGVKTNIVTAVEIADKNAGDSPMLPPLVKATAKGFTVKEVSADAAYSGESNMQAIHDVGAVPYIAFKDNATGGIGGLFAKSYHFYCLNRDRFLQHYHKRSNVESTFSMVKAKFGDALRSKDDVSMVNEALCKIVCHNLCCLIQSYYELGINATFWGKEETACEAVEGLEGEDEFAAMAWI